jgi:hypothetical protein
MLLKAAINGKQTATEHPSIPITPGQQAHEEAALAVAAGAGAIHLHPRSSSGEESLESGDVAATLDAVRAAFPGTRKKSRPGRDNLPTWAEPEVFSRPGLGKAAGSRFYQESAKTEKGNAVRIRNGTRFSAITQIPADAAGICAFDKDAVCNGHRSDCFKGGEPQLLRRENAGATLQAH